MALSDRVRFLYVCPLAWNRLTGDERVRYCAECQKTVTNLSEMSSAEADTWLQTQTDSVCVRLERDAAGRSLHWPDLRRVGLAATLATAAIACAPAGDETGDSTLREPGLPTVSAEAPPPDKAAAQPSTGTSSARDTGRAARRFMDDGGADAGSEAGARAGSRSAPVANAMKKAEDESEEAADFSHMTMGVIALPR